jgi:general secretion pathway protein A
LRCQRELRKPKIMVLEYYKLREQPFGVTPDARFLFLSNTHREALASLLYGIDSGCGFLTLIAKPGLGKTTLLFQLMHQLREKALTVFLFQTVCTPKDLLRALLSALGVQDTSGNLVQMQSRLKQVLVEQARLGKRVVVVIDEAQNLDGSVLELIRILSNFETPREKMTQIVFSGQPQLANKIGSPDLEQLRQRVSIFARLDPFSREETQLYIEHRLRFAGYTFDWPLFTRDAVTLIAEASEGVPRNISNLCFNSLALGCALQRKKIDTELVREVVCDLDLGRWRDKGPSRAPSAKHESEPVHAFLPGARMPSLFAGWIRKLALVLVVILLLGGSLFASRGWINQKPAAHIQNSPPPVAAPAPSSPAPMVAEIAGRADQVLPLPAGSSFPIFASLPSAAGRTVSVTSGKTLLGICTDSFGKCSPGIIEKIRKLNPRLQSNPDHIETGQTIRLPAANAIAERPGKNAIASKERP